jgi:hypothetical protein
VASGFFYNSAGQRQSMVDAERKWVDDRTQLILDLKHKARARARGRGRDRDSERDRAEARDRAQAHP